LADGFLHGTCDSDSIRCVEPPRLARGAGDEDRGHPPADASLRSFGGCSDVDSSRRVEDGDEGYSDTSGERFWA
jgi:hypothetical protein